LLTEIAGRLNMDAKNKVSNLDGYSILHPESQQKFAVRIASAKKKLAM